MLDISNYQFTGIEFNGGRPRPEYGTGFDTPGLYV